MSTIARVDSLTGNVRNFVDVLVLILHALPKGATRVERMRRKLQTKKGAAIYSTRKTVVEPVFGQIKEARGFRHFLLRGLKKVQGEWAIVCLTHNILKLHRLCYG